MNEEELGFKLKKRIRQVLGGSLHIRHVDTGSCKYRNKIDNQEIY